MTRKEQMRLLFTAASGAVVGGLAFVLFGKKKPTAEATVVAPSGSDRTAVREQEPASSAPEAPPAVTGGGTSRAGGARTAIPPLADASFFTRLGLRPLPRGLTPGSFPVGGGEVAAGVPPVLGSSWEELILVPVVRDGELIAFAADVSYPHRYWIAIPSTPPVDMDTVRARLEASGFRVDRVMATLPLIQTDVPAYDVGAFARFDVQYVRPEPSRVELRPGSRVWVRV